MRILKTLIKILVVLIFIAGLFVGVLTLFEYKPQAIEQLEIANLQTKKVKIGDELTFLTFNIGYSSLGKDEDFVMDGGKSGRPDSKEVVEFYLEGITNTLLDNKADFYLIQEVDLNSRRSYKINQGTHFLNELGNYSYEFAYNYKALFVPFPVSFTEYLGYVESGIATYSNYEVEASTRYQFPGSFSWPLRVANLKRAMMTSIIPIEGSDKKLIIVNLHMSAYDGDGSLRRQEMEFLKAFLIEQEKLGNYVIVGGDFNQTFPEAVGIYEAKKDFYVPYPIEEDFLPNNYSFEVDLNSPTCRLLNEPYYKENPNTQYYIIDGFIVSSNIEVITAAKTIDYDFVYSDHNPVTLTIKLK